MFVGILGGFTTFSAFAGETASLIHDGRGAAALLNIALQVIVGLFAVWLGGLLARFARLVTARMPFKNFLKFWNLG